MATWRGRRAAPDVIDTGGILLFHRSVPSPPDSTSEIREHRILEWPGRDLKAFDTTFLVFFLMWLTYLDCLELKRHILQPYALCINGKSVLRGAGRSQLQCFMKLHLSPFQQLVIFLFCLIPVTVFIQILKLQCTFWVSVTMLVFVVGNVIPQMPVFKRMQISFQAQCLGNVSFMQNSAR